MIKKILLTGIILLAFTGCATTSEYSMYAETQKAVAKTKSDAEIARYKALSEIAKSGDFATSVAAVMAIAMASGGQAAPQTSSNIAPPKSPGDSLLQWTSILLPNITQLYGINRNAQVAIQQSNNASQVAQSTNNAFVNMASKIQAPQANVTTTTDSSNSSVNTTSSTDSSNSSVNTTSSTDSSNSSVNTTSSTDSSNNSVNTPTTP